MGIDFTQVLRDNQSMVFSIALRFLGDREGAEELAQDVFLQFYRQQDKIEDTVHAAGWLRRAICHRSIDELRKRRLRPRIALESVPEPGELSLPPDLFLQDRLRRLLGALPEKARMVMVLRYQEDLDPTEIAGLLEMPLSTVKSHLHRSLTVLRARFSREEVCS